MKLYGYPAASERATEFRCPECGAPVSSGLPDPFGDRDDWLLLPHCTACSWVAPNAQEPFADAVPPGPLSRLWAWLEVRGDRVEIVLTRAGERPRFAFICELKHREGEPERAYWERAVQAAREEAIRQGLCPSAGAQVPRAESRPA